MYSFPDLQAVCYSTSSSNCASWPAQVVWYSHLLKNFPEFVAVHIVKGFGIVNKAEADAFLELSCFFDDPTDVGNLISGSSAFFMVNYCGNISLISVTIKVRSRDTISTFFSCSCYVMFRRKLCRLNKQEMSCFHFPADPEIFIHGL